MTNNFLTGKDMTNKRDQWAHDLVAKWPENSQPSDNLQQASTAQAEPTTDAKKCWCATCRPVTFLGDPEDNRMVLCPTCGNKRCPHANDHRNACTGSNEPGQIGSGNKVLSATDVKRRQKEINWQFLKFKESSVKSAQATPEGADLPPLPSAYAFAPSGHNTGDPYADAEDEQNDMCQEFTSLIAKGIYTADQMRDYARAALAASQQAAEPVCQVRDLEQSGFWSDVSIDNMMRCMDYGYKTRVLYRAVPPQQVDTGGLPG